MRHAEPSSSDLRVLTPDELAEVSGGKQDTLIRQRLRIGQPSDPTEVARALQ